MADDRGQGVTTAHPINIVARLRQSGRATIEDVELEYDIEDAITVARTHAGLPCARHLWDIVSKLTARRAGTVGCAIEISSHAAQTRSTRFF